MKSMRHFFALTLATICPGTLALAQDATPSVQAAQKLPVTTNSSAAARYYETGMVHFENHRWNFALRDWREAVHLDPRFALAYTWICFTTTDPAEESDARVRAKAAMSE